MAQPAVNPITGAIPTLLAGARITPAAVTTPTPNTNNNNASASAAGSRNTRHGVVEQTVMRNLMVHEGQTHLEQPNTSCSKTSWSLPRRGRQPEHYQAAREREGLSKGFAAFYNDDEQMASTRDGHIVAEKNRKHFEVKQSEEHQWKRGFKPTLPEIVPPRPRGKKNVPPVETRPALEEISDIPRGKKHLHQPENQLLGSGLQIAPSAGLSKKQKREQLQATTTAGGSEPTVGSSSTTTAAACNTNDADDMGGMSRKRLVMDEKRGVPVSWKGPPFFTPTEADETLFEGLRNRSVQRTDAQKRNGIPGKNPGDLPYNKVEQAPGYVQSMNPKASKCGYEKPPQPFVFVDRFAQKESGIRRTQEINDVRSLPNY